MNDNQYDRSNEERINELAKDYYYARIENNKAAANRASSEIFTLLMKKGSGPFNKTYAKIDSYSLIGNDPQSVIFELTTEALSYSFLKYKYEVSDKDGNLVRYPFFAYYMKMLTLICKEYIRKKNNKEHFEDYSVDTDPLEDDSMPVHQIADEKEDLAETSEKNELRRAVRIRLPSVVLGFYSHNKGKSASEIRLSYFRIFASESIIESILESSDTEYFNKTEAYDCTDKDFVRYISYSDYCCLDDIINIRFKKLSEVLSDFNGEDEQLYVPCENRVISEYRFVSKLDQTRKTIQAVFDQRSHYKKALAVLLNDMK